MASPDIVAVNRFHGAGGALGKHAIEQIGPAMAHVKLRCAIPPRYFTDLLSLLKIEGRWQVAQKVFMTDMRD